MNETDLEVQWLPYLLKKMQTELLPKQEYTYLQYLLMKYEGVFRFHFDYPLCTASITGDKIMFISDSHYGSDQIKGTYLAPVAYDKAIQQNIKTVVHAGDLLEACSVEHAKTLENVMQELETALYYMPEELTTKLLLGNHDYSAIRTYPQIIPNFFHSPKLEILGMKKVLLNWDGQISIRLNHKITQLKDSTIEEAKELITFEGHYHSYEVLEDTHTIKLPSTLPISLFGTIASFTVPLFVIASKQAKNIFIFETYAVDEKTQCNQHPSETIEVNTKTKQLKRYK